MEELQAKMMEIQMKYAANPTSENMLKLQEEMAILSQQMSGAYTQMATGEGFDESDLFEVDQEAIEQFIRDHPVPADKEKYLPIGALLIITHDEPWQTIIAMVEKEYWSDVLKEGWGIKNITEGRKMLSSLLEGRHNAKFGEEFRKFKAGKPSKLDDESIENYEDTMECLKEYLPVLLPIAQKCENIYAWDLERVGYLARIYLNMGWLNEDETFEWLDKAAKIIKKEYPGWKEYIAAILVGRAVAFSFDDVVVAAAEELLTSGKAALEKHPVSRL